MRRSIFIVLNLLLATTHLPGQSAQPLRLWYDSPASALAQDGPDAWKDDPEWLKALPLGNGRLGAMIFGDVHQERIQLNEKTLWSGSPDDNNNPDAIQYLDSIRGLLFAGKFREATELTNRTQVCKGAGSGQGQGANVPFGCYQTLGDLRIDFQRKSPWSHYRRELNLNEAVAWVQYRQDGILFTREMFVSAPANTLVMRITAGKKGSIGCRLALDRPERFATTAAQNELTMRGRLNNGKGGQGMAYVVCLKTRQKGGRQTVNNNTLVIENADEVVLLLTAATDYTLFYPYYTGSDPGVMTGKTLGVAFAQKYSRLKKAHLRDYQRYFNRVSLQLADTIPSGDIPTDERLRRFKTEKNDNYLTQLYFQYGRYLLISSARGNTLPANLQGIWANKIQTAWNCDYHTNINVQMNYWPAEVTNLPEIHLSLIRYIQHLEAPATQSARIQFGARGWCVNPINNVWGFTAPGEHPSWGLTAGAGGWLCRHLWEHYLFTLDTNYLRGVFPTLKNAALFYLDWLVDDPRSGLLVSGPASSPENAFQAPDGSRGTISMGPSHDQQIIDELFSNVVAAANVLNKKDTLVAQVDAARKRLLQTRIGSDGRLLEWAEPYPEPEPGHRHMSHLYGLHPGYAFNNKNTPEYLEAARKSLEYRLAHGGGHTGWSAAWVSNFQARLKNGDAALAAVNDILLNKTAENLFDLHPPFHLDGNFGATAGLAEMLLQSHTGTIELLPALPGAWKNGAVEGLKARGGFEVDMRWREGKLSRVIVRATVDGPCTLAYGGKSFTFPAKAGKTYSPKMLWSH